ncbi:MULTISPECIES: SPOR domain-containing protein [unclassified Rhizobium]|uniref:SPOR domain-containing protein n=1 Tax=unclassified Rhizobium TaxID=2613769 RepID=UPI001AD95526|nr:MULTISPECIES: SPOR domain-containing protein [unclassified Rhizobium]MBO9098711.1 SPOR domain-containing protein [Rhizobium sp. L58/93]MBO9168977.1 SPOR domain-containing protein [Rhizobium sp. L245/93]MBO9184927.1 SPOR domain-containing protein [Rhizobium sp. E27B/91]QXZ85090.1 SPOR domain-containing protein [Rhizobium sp. K1/93]QXZ90771.1 SPOR domain-containing protein [Rhizobium sp. K15/93]
MAEKQLAYRAGGKDEFFADDDPLAELARIVGYDKRPSTPVAANQRQEPAFDLEDELLREFERYDAPRSPQASQPNPAVYSEPVYGNGTPANDFAAVEPTHAPEPQSEVQAAYDAPAAEHVRQPEEPVHAEPPVVDASHFEPAEESWEAVVEPTTMPVAAEELEELASAPEVANRDLVDELEMSISAPDVQPTAPRTQQWAAATIRLPLANFNAPRREPTMDAFGAVEPVPTIEPVAPAAPPEVATVVPEPVAEFVAHKQPSYPVEMDRAEAVQAETPVVSDPDPVVGDVHVEEEAPLAGVDLPPAARAEEVAAATVVPEPAPVSAASSYQGLDIDDLLADVSRYPVPSREQIAARIDPSLVNPAAPRPSMATPVMAQPEPVKLPDPEPVVAAADEDFDGFDEHDFDLDLADIELELAELDFADPKSLAEVEKPAKAAEPATDWRQPEPLAAVQRSPSYAAAAASTYASAAAPTYASAAAPAEPRAAIHEAEPVVDSYQELPFDPNEISETEDRVETFEDIHVPALPPAEPDEPVVAAPDYDFDIDAEMASLFSAPADTSPEPASAPSMTEAAFAPGVATSVPVRGVTMQQKTGGGLDEFERALEEDFRQSFRETPSRPENVSPMMFESSHTANDRWRARSMRGIAIAAAAVVVLGGGAYGMYRWVSHNGSPISFASGEPRVITADKDPVKVVPTDPGGKVVPNQDKAVYDRVAGAATQPPKQKELVTSDEQPVDVVQKTLIPENSLPDDNDGSGEANLSTPVGETEDPRLLPGQGNPAATSQDGNSGVAARRVRTMIVKPDGSLVAREEAAPADDSATPSAPAAAAAPTTPAADNSQMASADDGDAPSADSAPIRTVKTTQIANAPAAAQPPVNTPAAGSTDAAPVPTARPTQTASATPAAAKPPVAPQPVRVASATQAAQPVKAAPAATASASAGGYGMQIASLPSEQEAKRSQANMAAKYASVIGGHPMEVRKVDIAGKGTYYRVRVAVGSKDDAAALCVKFRAAGGTCLISK